MQVYSVLKRTDDQVKKVLQYCAFIPQTLKTASDSCHKDESLELICSVRFHLVFEQLGITFNTIIVR